MIPEFEKHYKKAQWLIQKAYKELKPLREYVSDTDFTGLLMLRGEFEHLQDALKEFAQDQFGYGITRRRKG